MYGVRALLSCYLHSKTLCQLFLFTMKGGQGSMMSISLLVQLDLRSRERIRTEVIFLGMKCRME
jgi:hypothetical protein